jgi:hypothetical protein
MPEALEGIKQSVAVLQQEMAAGKVAELQEELVALAAQVGPGAARRRCRPLWGRAAASEGQPLAAPDCQPLVPGIGALPAAASPSRQLVAARSTDTCSASAVLAALPPTPPPRRPQVAVLPKEQPKALADTVMQMLDSAAVCLQDHDRQIVEMRQQVASLEALLEPVAGAPKGGSKMAGMVSDVGAMQAQVEALMVGGTCRLP